MVASRAAKQGKGVTPPFKPNPIDFRMLGLGTLSLSTCVLLIAVTGLPLIEAEGPGTISAPIFGDVTLWKFDFDATTMSNFGTADENDKTTAKAVGIRHTSRGSTHKEVAEDISRGSLYCTSDSFSTCSSIRDVNRMFIAGQGMLLSAMGVSFGILTLIPLTGIRLANQALIYLVFNVAVAVLVIFTAGHFAHKLEDELDDVFNSIYPGINVSYNWRSGGICLFVAAAFSGLSLILSGILTAWCWNDPYGPGEGPNYDENNPMPPHFKPRVLPPEDDAEVKLDETSSATNSH
eukprot:TRINITY_DN21816_c0_g1_i1.p1 TRINITY_DN21816_c0_g1~~TRINITY_DN21816_c0_g1_i1.p1  ORF type:complete len:292 (+),score=35.06 TRINITY_DN21816_c0_g1_i1:57-932(+)